MPRRFIVWKPAWRVMAAVAAMALVYAGCSDKAVDVTGDGTQPKGGNVDNGASPDAGTPVTLPDLGLGSDGVVRVRK